MADTKKCTGKTSRKYAGMWLCCALGVTLCLLSACASSPRQKASALGQEQGFSVRLFSTKLFTLCGLLRPGLSSHSKILRVYIEGDGHAWESRTRPSTNPTPRNPVALRLAMADPGADTVLYLARPCQYVQGEDWRQCSKRYWTSARLGPEVMKSLDAAITLAKSDCGAEQVILVGFSGGGGAAAPVPVLR